MILSISEKLRDLAATGPGGEIVKKFLKQPKIKPPRRQPSVKNKSDRSDYMKEFMTEYREEGKDYQKKPEKLKKFRREQKKNPTIKAFP